MDKWIKYPFYIFQMNSFSSRKNAVWNFRIILIHNIYNLLDPKEYTSKLLTKVLLNWNNDLEIEYVLKKNIL